MSKINLCLVFLVSVFLFSACPKKIKIFPSDDFTKEARSKYDIALADLERNRRLWQESRTANYDFEIGYFGGAMSIWGSGAIRVRDGKRIAPQTISEEPPPDYHEI